MRILFDQGTPAPLRRHFAQHEVVTAFELGWSALSNGALLDHAESEGYEVLVTTDTNLRFQQHLEARSIAVVVLTTTSWPRIERVAESVRVAVEEATTSRYVVVTIP